MSDTIDLSILLWDVKYSGFYSCCRTDQWGSILAYESRESPRELYISPGEKPLEVMDVISHPLQPCSLCSSSRRVWISLCHWKHQQSVKFVDVSWTIPSAKLVSLLPGCIIYEEKELSDVKMEMEDGEIPGLEREVVTVTAEKLERILVQPSLVHQDGHLIIQRANGKIVELHITIITAMSTTSPPSLHHQLLYGYSQTYKPYSLGMHIGHRGCGMNTVDSSYTEIGINEVDSKPNSG